MRATASALLLAMASFAGGAQDDPTKQAPRTLENPEKHGIGKKVQSPDLAACLQGAKLLVVTFTGTDCPISKHYRPKLGRLEKDFRAKGVSFVTVDDASSPLVAALDARRTTEAFVLDDASVLRYRGAIDDQYGIGYAKDAPSRTYLVDALEALLAGRSPPAAATEAPGCAIERPVKPAPATGAPVTFHRDIAPILHRRCVECHRPGEIGPFPLLTYAKARSSSARIKEAVTRRLMPPWHADPKHGRWENDRSLSQGEVDAIVRWVDAGSPEGDPKDALPPPKFLEGWAIGTPDAVYSISRPEKVPAEGTVPYKYLFVPTRLAEDRWVQAMEVRPTARKVVHHILVFVQYPLNRLKEQPKIDGGLHHGYFGIMVPGERPTVFPEGTGKLLPAGSTLIFQIHYTATGEAAEDQSAIGLVFAKKPPGKVVVTRGIVNERIRIPAGAPNHPEVATFTFPHDAKILSFLPHMHVRGKSFRYTAIDAEGKEAVLLDVPAYDFRWQSVYRCAAPLTVKAGTKIRANAHFDNSKGNPANPDPTRDVRFGQQTWEEMLIGYVDFVRE